MIEIYKKQGFFYFRIKARNGEVLATSEGYASKVGVENGVASVRKNSQREIIDLTKKNEKNKK